MTESVVIGHAMKLVNQEQGHALIAQVIWPKCKEELKLGHELIIEVSYAEDKMTDKQRKYLHGFVLTQIAKQARVNGEAFPMVVWKEWYRSTLLGFKVKSHRNPFGKTVRRRERISTEDLGLRRTIDYIDQVIAHAVTELGVRFPEEWTDPETGEIFYLRDSIQRRAAKLRQEELARAKEAEPA